MTTMPKLSSITLLQLKKKIQAGQQRLNEVTRYAPSLCAPQVMHVSQSVDALIAAYMAEEKRLQNEMDAYYPYPMAKLG